MSDLPEFIIDTRARLQAARERIREKFGDDAAGEVGDLLLQFDQAFASLIGLEPECPDLLYMARDSWPPAVLADDDPERIVEDSYVRSEVVAWARTVVAEFERQFQAVYSLARHDTDREILEIQAAEQYRQFGELLDGISYQLRQLATPLN